MAASTTHRHQPDRVLGSFNVHLMQTCAGSHIVLSSITNTWCSWPVNLQVLACSWTLGLDVVLGAADDEMTAPYPKSSCHVGSVALLLLGITCWQILPMQKGMSLTAIYLSCRVRCSLFDGVPGPREAPKTVSQALGDTWLWKKVVGHARGGTPRRVRFWLTAQLAARRGRRQRG